jgi:hypothetical protein
LHFDINTLEAFRAYIDVDKTRVDRPVELAEPRNETHGALLDLLERVGERAAWNSTDQAYTYSQGL